MSTVESTTSGTYVHLHFYGIEASFYDADETEDCLETAHIYLNALRALEMIIGIILGLTIRKRYPWLWV